MIQPLSTARWWAIFSPLPHSGPFSETLQQGIQGRRLKAYILTELNVRNLLQMFVDPASRHLESFCKLLDGPKLFTHERTPLDLGLRPRCDSRPLHSSRAALATGSVRTPTRQWRVIRTGIVCSAISSDARFRYHGPPRGPFIPPVGVQDHRHVGEL